MSILSDSISGESITGHIATAPKVHDPHATRIGKFLQAAIKFGGSDLIVKTGVQPKLRLRGALKPLDTDPVSKEDFDAIVQHLLGPEQIEDLHKYGSVDFAYDYDGDNRFRVNLFQSRGSYSIAARLITSNILPFEKLHLPPIMSEIALQPQGIVILAGVTGSGKSTTIASMLDYINQNKQVHIVTLEDPIEYIFKDKKSTIHQREIGLDCLDFKIGLRALVRENPDVVLIGEMRDAETFEAALHAAETGHLVFGTIHASSAPQTFARIYDLFAAEERDQVRKIMAFQMRAIIYQKLLPTLKPDVPRVPAVEILINSASVRKYIMEGREDELLDVIKSQESNQMGMTDFNGSLVKLVETEFIHTRVAMESTPNQDELKMRLKGIG
ncbi:MAG: PilT/PilU family type 4a pilus ATPase [Phycisphaerales bacterium]|nr:PilT/PilU family type 4a pilus ATPase [Phycisphaerales bacterium]